MKALEFNSEIGHREIQDRILNSIQNDRLPHAFLFYGNEGVGKEAFAIELAKLLNCEKGPLFLCGKCSQCVKIGKLQHPDIKYILPAPSQSNMKIEDYVAVLEEKAKNPFRRVRFGNKNTFISIDTIRELKKESKFKLYEGKKKVFIISEAESMRPEAANALLKILEEPPANLMLILTTSQVHRILPTIRSRCQLIHFSPLKGDLIVKLIHKYTTDPPKHLSRIIRLALENVKLAFDFIEDDVIEKREMAIEFLRKAVLIEKSQELITQIEKLTASRDRSDMRLILFFLLSWFRDIIHYKADAEKAENLINFDLEKNLRGFSEGYPNANYPQIIKQIQRSIRELEDPRNLNPTLIFTDLSIKLNNMIKFV